MAMDNDKQDHQFLDLTVVLVVIVLNPLSQFQPRYITSTPLSTSFICVEG